MTLLFFLKPHFYPSGVGTPATGRAPKKRWRKKIRKWFLSMAPSFAGAFSDDHRRLAKQQQEEAAGVEHRVEGRRRDSEDSAVLMMLEEDYE